MCIDSAKSFFLDIYFECYMYQFKSDFRSNLTSISFDHNGVRSRQVRISETLL